jgi:hypothetical protein
VLLDQVVHAQQQALALVGCPPAPVAFERATGRRRRLVDVGGVALGNAGDDLAGGGIEGVEFLAGRGGEPLAADEQPLGSAQEGGLNGGCG